MALAERELKNYVNESVGVSLDEWIRKNDGLLKQVAGHYYWKYRKMILPYDFDDLYQIAALSVSDSYKKFAKVNDNVDFKKYAMHYMHFKVERFISFKARAIHIPLLKRKEVSGKVLSLNVDANSGEGDELQSFLLKSEEINIEDLDIKMFVESIAPELREVLLPRMDLMSNEQIGKMIGTSRETVRNRLKKVVPLWQAWNERGEIV